MLKTIFKNKWAFFLFLFCSLLLVCFLFFSKYFVEQKISEEKKLWALAMSALLTERNKEDHYSLSGNDLNPQNIEKKRETLYDWWDISNSDDLWDMLYWLDEEGHREEFEEVGKKFSALSEEGLEEYIENELSTVTGIKRKKMAYRFDVVKDNYKKLGNKSLLGWDYCRYISLCRWGYFVGYLSEDEAWEEIIYAAEILNETFDSWADLGQNYLIGRKFWSYNETLESEGRFNKVYERLLNHPESPWNIIPWKLKTKITDLTKKEHADLCIVSGKAYLSQGKIDQAKKKFDQAAAVHPKYRELIGHLFCSQATEYYKQVMIKEAIQSWELSLSFGHVCSFANYKLACCYALNNDADSALKYLKAGLKIDPDKIRSTAADDSALNNIRQDQRFSALLK